MRETSTHSTLAAYVALVRERKWIVAVGLVLVPFVALLVTLRQPAKYQGQAEVYFNKQNVASAITGIQDQPQTGNEDRQAQTQADLASVDEVARRALLITGVKNLSPKDLRSASSVTTKATSDILRFTVKDADPARAKILASGYAKAFTEYRAQLDSATIKKARKVVAGKLALLAAQGKTESPLYASLFDKEQLLATLEILQTRPPTLCSRPTRPSRPPQPPYATDSLHWDSASSWGWRRRLRWMPWTRGCGTRRGRGPPEAAAARVGYATAKGIPAFRPVADADAAHRTGSGGVSGVASEP